MKNNIAIIIPCYKENDKEIFESICDLNNKFSNTEIIISDGSYNIETAKKLNKYKNVKYVDNKNKTRASGMNLGTSKSKADIFLFLHLDTSLPNNAEKILKNIDLDKYNYGGFYKKFDSNSFGLTLNSFLTNLKLKYFSSLLGDNSIFISRKLFQKIGGFANISLMEDVDISRKLKKVGKIKIIKYFCITSSRKFSKHGFIRTIIFMQYLRFLYIIGISPSILEEKYRNFGK